MTVSALRGRPALVWFVTTWCSSCQAGTEVMTRKVSSFTKRRVRIVELELYRDLGGSGPGIAAFGRRFAGRAFTDPDWIWGYASRALSFTYDPQGYLDIYYLLDARGVVRYVNGGPAATMPQLLQAISRLSPSPSG